MSEATCTTGKRGTAGMDVSQLRRLKELETRECRAQAHVCRSVADAPGVAGCRSKKALAPVRRAELVDVMVD